MGFSFFKELVSNSLPPARVIIRVPQHEIPGTSATSATSTTTPDPPQEGP